MIRISVLVKVNGILVRVNGIRHYSFIDAKVPKMFYFFVIILGLVWSWYRILLGVSLKVTLLEWRKIQYEYVQKKKSKIEALNRVRIPWYPCSWDGFDVTLEWELANQHQWC
jgi:hypothetical protein